MSFRWFVPSFVAVLALMHGRAFAVEGPSFDCSQGVRHTLAVILCSDPEAGTADWDMNRAYWATFSDDREQNTFSESVIRDCALPEFQTQQQRAGRVLIEQLSRTLGGQIQLPSSQSINQQHVRCVVRMFREHARQLRQKLRGDALNEANLSPEEHMDIQNALIRKGFLQNRIRRYGATADGQFGPNTRLAIKNFQGSIGAEATGFLSAEQQLDLLENPAERERRLAGLAAREKAKQEAAETQRRAEEQAKAEREKVRQEAAEAQRRAKEQAEQAAAEREKAKKEADDKAKRAAAELERKRLEEEAQRATEWRSRIDEAQKRGTEYAKLGDTKWSLAEKLNPMTDDTEYTVSSRQTNGTGALANVTGFCSKDRVMFEATLHSSEDKVPLSLANSSAGGVVGNKRLNDGKVFATNFPIDKWRNRIILSRQSFEQDDPESADTTWRVLAEIETSGGTLYIKIPMMDEKIQKLVAACKRRH